MNWMRKIEEIAIEIKRNDPEYKLPFDSSEVKKYADQLTAFDDLRLVENHEEKVEDEKQEGQDEHEGDHNIEEWLREIGFERYFENFKENEFNNLQDLIEVANDITESDLKEIGVKALMHRKKIFKAIKNLL